MIVYDKHFALKKQNHLENNQTPSLCHVTLAVGHSDSSFRME